MGDGSSNDDRNNNAGGIIRGIDHDLTKDLIKIFIAVALGSGISVGVVRNDPARSVDRFTGQQGELLQQRVRNLETAQFLDDDYRKSALDRQSRMILIEQKYGECANRIKDIQRQLDQIRRQQKQ